MKVCFNSIALRALSAIALKCMGTPPSPFIMFSKGDNSRDFPVAYLKGEVY